MTTFVKVGDLITLQLRDNVFDNLSNKHLGMVTKIFERDKQDFKFNYERCLVVWLQNEGYVPCEYSTLYVSEWRENYLFWEKNLLCTKA